MISIPKDFPYEIGEHTYFGTIPEIRFPGRADLRIGKFCSIGKGLIVYLGGNHTVKYCTTYPLRRFLLAPEERGPGNWSHISRDDVVIGNDVWIGDDVTILSGAHIFDGAILGNHAVIRGNVPAYAITIGNPAIVIDYRFEQKNIVCLLAIRWWNWPMEKIKEAIPLLLSGEVRKLCEFYFKEIKEKA